mgnify:FL=1|tara:strand:+ start:329 stop:595 length:267 start_codon:yes stop_codon:yes gene_type:complete
MSAPVISDEPVPEPANEVAEPEVVAPVAKPKRVGTKMTDKQKADLKKHMVKMEKGGMTKSEMKSHRMKMMGKMRKGMTINKAHKAITA